MHTAYARLESDVEPLPDWWVPAVVVVVPILATPGVTLALPHAETRRPAPARTNMIEAALPTRRN
jgi:hypothetical protein